VRALRAGPQGAWQPWAPPSPPSLPRRASCCVGVGRHSRPVSELSDIAREGQHARDALLFSGCGTTTSVVKSRGVAVAPYSSRTTERFARSFLSMVRAGTARPTTRPTGPVGRVRPYPAFPKMPAHVAGSFACLNTSPAFLRSPHVSPL
jgi:hypothetical protein